MNQIVITCVNCGRSESVRWRFSASSSVSTSGAGAIVGAGLAACSAAARGSCTGQSSSVHTVTVVPTRLWVQLLRMVGLVSRRVTQRVLSSNQNI